MELHGLTCGPPTRTIRASRLWLSATKAGRNGDGRHGGRVGGGLDEVMLPATTPRPATAGGLIPDHAAPDSNHRSVTPLPSIQFGEAILQLSSAPGKGFWARHRCKMLLLLGVAGTGYVAYRFYDAHQRQLFRVEQHQFEEKAVDKLVKNQLQAHFDNVQRISDSTTLPFAMHDLCSWIMEEPDILHLAKRLLQGKRGDSSVLTPKEKLGTW